MTKMALLAAALCAGSAAAREPGQQTVTICLQTDRNPEWLLQPIVERAQLIAGQIIASAGVRLDWRANLADCTGKSAKAIQVDLSCHTPPNVLPGALGYAQPFQDAYAHVFCDRIHRAVRADQEPYLLGHVLAHEITHVLQGTNFHAVSGVMKAVWDFRDCGRMTLQPLKFTATDIILIRQGLEDRAELHPARWHAPPVEIAAVQ